MYERLVPFLQGHGITASHITIAVACLQVALVILAVVLSIFAVALVPGPDWAAFPLFITLMVVIYCVAAATSKTFRAQCD